MLIQHTHPLTQPLQLLHKQHRSLKHKHTDTTHDQTLMNKSLHQSIHLNPLRCLTSLVQEVPLQIANLGADDYESDEDEIQPKTEAIPEENTPGTSKREEAAKPVLQQPKSRYDRQPKQVFKKYPLPAFNQFNSSNKPTPYVQPGRKIFQDFNREYPSLWFATFELRLDCRGIASANLRTDMLLSHLTEDS